MWLNGAWIDRLTPVGITLGVVLIAFAVVTAILGTRCQHNSRQELVTAICAAAVMIRGA